MNEKLKKHWEKVYQRESNEFSWKQEIPKSSLDFIRSFHLPKDASIIDIGSGDSKLIDFLLDEGYENITVLDISSKALDRTRIRLGEKAEKVTWTNSDIIDFHPDMKYDLWHDRATFHFLTTDEQITKYLAIAKSAVSSFMILATFSDKGPDKCSGLDVKQYSEVQLQNTLLNGFDKIRCITEDHTTPFNTNQNFLYCSFKRQIG